MSSHPFRLRRRSGLVAVAALAVLAIGAAPASAVVVPATSSHSAISYVPAFGSAHASTTACGLGEDCSAITYHGGPVQHGERLVPIFWVGSGDSIPATFESDIVAWIQNFSKLDYTPSTVFSVAQQYYDASGPGGSHRFIPDAISYGGSYTDTDAFPTSDCSDSQNGNPTLYCFTQAQEASEVQSFVGAHGLPTGRTTEYLLFTPADVGSCFDSSPGALCAYADYCAYHASIDNTSSTGEIVWANEPWEYQVTGCDINETGFPAGYPSNSMADPEFSTLSHELIETMTDLNGNAWLDGNGQEIGDKCAYNYNGTDNIGSSATPFAGLSNNGNGYYNQTAGGKQYLMQTQFSDENSDGTNTGCVAGISDAQPTISVSPKAATRGVATQFTAPVTTPAAAFAYTRWIWRDGTAQWDPSTTITHTFSTSLAPGRHLITVIVTDARGNTKRVYVPVTLS